MAEALRSAAEIVDLALKPKPELFIHSGNLPASVEALHSDRLYDRGLPVRFVEPFDGASPSAVALTRNNVVMETHRLCQPVKIDSQGKQVEVTLPDRAAQMYLDMVGEWKLRPLAGISMAPLLFSDGSMRAVRGALAFPCCRCRSIPLSLRRSQHLTACAPHSTPSRFRTPNAAGTFRLASRWSTLRSHQDGTRAPSWSPFSRHAVVQAFGWHPACW